MKVDNINKTWLTSEEAAKYLGKTKNAVWKLVGKGILEKRKWQRRLYFRKSDLDRLIDSSLLREF